MKKKLGLYSPYLDVLGGGEKHILSILKALENKYELNIFWDKNLAQAFEKKFSLYFKSPIIFLKNIFNLKTSIFKKAMILKNFDLFFYVTDGSYFVSTAKNNYVFCMYPQKNIYNLNLLNKLKLINYRFISNSRYTSNWLNKWGIRSTVLYPYIDDVFFETKKEKKEKIILSVGRFYKHLHSKQHETTIRLFKEMKKKVKALADFKLVLIGSVKNEDQPYIHELQELIKNDLSIELKQNISFKDLIVYYKKSTFYLHMAGFGVNENKHPEQVEHLGITPLEAMAAGNIVFCLNVGGPKEIIKDGINGYLFNNSQDLTNKLSNVVKNNNLQKKIKDNAKKMIKKQFSYNEFVKNVNLLIE